MAPIDDDTLDRLLTRHLSARLDGQLGRAEAAFRQRLTGIAPLRLTDDAADDAPPPASTSLLANTADRSFWHRPAGRLVGVASTAIAASLATVMLLPLTGWAPQGRPEVAQTQPSQESPGDPSPRPPAVQPEMRYVHNQTIDEGTVSPGNADTAVRRVRIQRLERVRYFNEALGAWVEMVIPREDVRHYMFDTY